MRQLEGGVGPSELDDVESHVPEYPLPLSLLEDDDEALNNHQVGLYSLLSLPINHFTSLNRCSPLRHRLLPKDIMSLFGGTRILSKERRPSGEHIPTQ